MVLGVWIQTSRAQNAYYSDGQLAYVQAADIAYFKNGSLAYSGAANIAYYSNGSLAYVGSAGKAYYSNGQLAYCTTSGILLDKSGTIVTPSTCPQLTSSTNETIVRLQKCPHLSIRIKDDQLTFVVSSKGSAVFLE